MVGKIGPKGKLIFFFALILAIVMISYIKSLMYGGNKEIALILAIVLTFVIIFGATMLTKKYAYQWDKRLK